jgi:hypothetical protein
MFVNYTTIKSDRDMPSAVFGETLSKSTAMKDFAFFVFRDSENPNDRRWFLNGKYAVGFLNEFDEKRQNFYWTFQDSEMSFKVPVQNGDLWCAVPLYLFE